MEGRNYMGKEDDNWVEEMTCLVRSKMSATIRDECLYMRSLYVTQRNAVQECHYDGLTDN